MQKKILYFDMDNVLVDFQSGIDQLSEEVKCEYEERLDEVPGIFSLMKPIPEAIDTVKFLAEYFDVYILSTAPWKNPSAWTDKVNWVHQYFGIEKDTVFYKRLIISHHKNLNKGGFLVDDRTKNGANEFEGELIQFGSEKFPDWSTVKNYLINHDKLGVKKFCKFISLKTILTALKDIKIKKMNTKKNADVKSDEYLTFYGELEYWNGEDDGDVRYCYLMVNSKGKIVTEFSDYNRPNLQIQQSQTLLQKALIIVSNAFCYQKDKAGKPYIFHLLYVMGKGQNEKEKIVGALHDLIEDCGETYADVILKEFGQEIFDAVKCLTKIKGEDYDIYLKRVKDNYLSRQVKLYDLEHNMDISRLRNPKQEDYERLEKYKKSYNYLKS